jgi:hypothetical protein
MSACCALGGCIRGMCWSKPIACYATNGSATRFSPRTPCRKLDSQRQGAGATARDSTSDLLAEPSRQGTSAHRCAAEDWQSDVVWSRRVDLEFLPRSGFEMETAPRDSNAFAAQVPADIPLRFAARPAAPPCAKLRATRHTHLARNWTPRSFGSSNPDGDHWAASAASLPSNHWNGTGEAVGSCSHPHLRGARTDGSTSLHIPRQGLGVLSLEIAPALGVWATGTENALVHHTRGDCIDRSGDDRGPCRRGNPIGGRVRAI